MNFKNARYEIRSTNKQVSDIFKVSQRIRFTVVLATLAHSHWSAVGCCVNFLVQTFCSNFAVNLYFLAPNLKNLSIRYGSSLSDQRKAIGSHRWRGKLSYSVCVSGHNIESGRFPVLFKENAIRSVGRSLDLDTPLFRAFNYEHCT